MSGGVPGGAGFELGCDGPRVIVVGVDGSGSSWRALHWAIGLARRQSARVVAVCARPVGALAYAALPATLPVPPQQAGELADELAAAVEGLGRDHHVDVSFIALEGDPVAALTGIASDLHADQIIVGASEKAGHRIFGSTALRTVRTRKWPVTVVP